MTSNTITSTWTPEPDSLSYVVDILRESFVPDTEIQKSVQQKIAVLRTYPDFINYLLFILSNSDTYTEDIRALGGIILKNNIHLSFDKLTEDMLKYMKQKLLQLLSDPSKEVRGSITSLITVLICKGGFDAWPELLPHFSHLLESPNEYMCETALTALFKIYEEFLIKQDISSLEDSMKDLLTKFIQLVTCQRVCIRRELLRVLNLVLSHNNNSKDFDSAEYLKKLFEITDDNNPEIQRLVCEAFLTYVEIKDTAILPHMSYVIEYMLLKTQAEEKEISLQASEFWLTLASIPNCKTFIEPYLDRLLPILLKNMQYSEFELNCQKDLAFQDNHIPDDPSDVKPFNYLDENDFDDNYIGWTLRKCSAAALDSLSTKVGDEMLQTFIPLLNEALNDENCLRRESGILALGAIAEGCYKNLKPHLPQLLIYLMSSINNNHNMIKIITFWTLSRYMNYIVTIDPPEVYFIPIMSDLLKHILDNNKRVQRSALSAFCIFEEEARLKLIPYLDFIVHALLQAMDHCQFRSYYLLYDAIGSLALSVRNHLNKPEYVEHLVVPLVQKFVSYSEEYDDQFLALTEALSNLATAVEVSFLPYAEAVYDKSLSIINETMDHIHQYAEKPEALDPPDKDPMCAVHDLLLALAGTLKPYFVKFVTNSNLVQQLYLTMQDDTPSIRQSAFALFGELVRLCFSFLSDRIHDYIPIIIENLDTRFEAVCNNAAWVLGELCMAMGGSIEPYAHQIMMVLIRILEESNCLKSMYQTSAITLCALGYVCPSAVSPELDRIMRHCCQAMRNVRDCLEKEMGFRGLCVLVYRNPDALANNFGFFCDAVASWDEIRPDLRDNIKNIFSSFKHQYGAEVFEQNYSQFPEMLRIRLNFLYGV